MENIKFIVFLIGTFLMAVSLREWCDIFIWKKEPKLIGGILWFFLLALSFAGFIGLLVGMVIVKAI